MSKRGKDNKEDNRAKDKSFLWWEGEGRTEEGRTTHLHGKEEGKDNKGKEKSFSR